MVIKSNNIPRPLFRADELPEGVATEWFDYVDTDDYSARFFEYRGSWYDYYEFQTAPSDFASKGWNAVQGESYFSAVLVRYFERDGYELDDSIVVGYAHW